MDSTNIRLSGLTYQGGDDCVAIKPRSYNIDIQDVTCNGGNGIAIGSLGMYLADESVHNVIVNNVSVCCLSVHLVSPEEHALLNDALSS